MKVLIVDDQSLVRQGLSILLNSEADIEVVGEAANGSQACDMAAELRPDAVLMDLRMPLMDGVQATAKILQANPTIKIIVLTTFDDDEYLIGSLRAGAKGYLLKDTPFAEVAEALRVVLSGKSLLSGEMMAKLLNTVHHPLNLQEPAAKSHSATAAKISKAVLSKLSEREHEVLTLIGKGKTNAEIAVTLCLSEGTVKNHVTKILATIGAKSRLQAALFMQEQSQSYLHHD
ncbi:MAG: response regulator transcription factor [Cyanobacteria bacterium REEB67]|nr:response regulator transcription factor [Cyanobacteria bacterium REEB67]